MPFHRDGYNGVFFHIAFVGIETGDVGRQAAISAMEEEMKSKSLGAHVSDCFLCNGLLHCSS